MLSFNIKDKKLIPLSEKVSPFFNQTKFSYRIHGLSIKKQENKGIDILVRTDYNLTNLLELDKIKIYHFFKDKKINFSTIQLERINNKVYIGLSEKLRKDINLAAKSLITLIAMIEKIEE